MPKRQCKGKTKAGKRCRNPVVAASGYCLAHDPENRGENRRFGGRQPGAGRPRTARPSEVMREWVEEHVQELLDPYVRGLRATIVVKTGVDDEGEPEFSAQPDIEFRQKSAERLLDRAYGRPAQAVELTGSDNGPAIEIVAKDDRAAGIAAEEFLRRLAS